MSNAEQLAGHKKQLESLRPGGDFYRRVVGHFALANAFLNVTQRDGIVSVSFGDKEVGSAAGVLSSQGDDMDGMGWRGVLRL